MYSFAKVLGTETRIAASFGKGLLVSNINSTLEFARAAWELYVMAAVLLEMIPRTVVVTNTSGENSARSKLVTESVKIMLVKELEVLRLGAFLTFSMLNWISNPA